MDVIQINPAPSVFFKNVNSHINENDPIHIYTCIFKKLLRNIVIKGS